MQAEKHGRSWKVSVDARSSGLRFKLKVARVTPGPNFDRISLLLRLRKFVLNLTAGSKPSLPSPMQRQKRSDNYKSRFRKALEKLRARRVKRTQPLSLAPQQSTNSQNPDGKFLGNFSSFSCLKDPTRVGFCWIVAILIAIFAILWRFLRESTWERIIQFLSHAFLYYSGN